MCWEADSENSESLQPSVRVACVKHTEKLLEDDFQRNSVTDDVLELTIFKTRKSDPKESHASSEDKDHRR